MPTVIKRGKERKEKKRKKKAVNISEGLRPLANHHHHLLNVTNDKLLVVYFTLQYTVKKRE